LRQGLSFCYCQQRFGAFDGIDPFEAFLGNTLQCVLFCFAQGTKRDFWVCAHVSPGSLLFSM